MLILCEFDGCWPQQEVRLDEFSAGILLGSSVLVHKVLQVLKTHRPRIDLSVTPGSADLTMESWQGRRARWLTAEWLMMLDDSEVDSVLARICTRSEFILGYCGHVRKTPRAEFL